MRVFIALDLNREAMNEIKRVQDIIRKKTLVTGKFTETENLHLTLKFLGEVEEKEVDIIKEKLREIKFCSFECSKEQWKTEEYKQNAKKNGQKGGKVSAQKQSRRSQNEVYFAQLCQEYFHITTNETFFDGWDADVIIHKDKIALLWNGIWHYKQISKTQSLVQVQARDKVKTAIIEKYEYAPFVIKDMGKHDKGFVEQEFAVFLLFRMASKILE